MTQPALPSPSQLLSGPAQALAGIERSLPLGAPPVSISQVMLSVAGSIPAIPVPGGVGGGLPFPVPGGVGGGLPLPLGAPGNIIAALTPLAPRAPLAPNASRLILPAGRTGIG